jgi:hypothetical protein
LIGLSHAAVESIQRQRVYYWTVVYSQQISFCTPSLGNVGYNRARMAVTTNPITTLTILER